VRTVLTAVPSALVSLILALRLRLADPSFLARHRVRPEDFTRRRKLPFLLVMFGPTGVGMAQARISVLYDLLNRAGLDARLEPRTWKAFNPTGPASLGGARRGQSAPASPTSQPGQQLSCLKKPITGPAGKLPRAGRNAAGIAKNVHGHPGERALPRRQKEQTLPRPHYQKRVKKPSFENHSLNSMAMGVGGGRACLPGHDLRARRIACMAVNNRPVELAGSSFPLFASVNPLRGVSSDQPALKKLRQCRASVLFCKIPFSTVFHDFGTITPPDLISRPDAPT
jgi:hypothetical protein